MTITEERRAAVPATGAEVLDEARAFRKRFVMDPSPAALDAATVWEQHTHCVGTDGKLLFDSTPRLAYLSDEPGSGKSRALEVTGSLSRKPALVADVTGPAMHTLISQGACLLVDELDLVLGAGDSAKPIRAAINAGYRRSGAVARNKGMASVFAPVALAGLAITFSRNPLLEPTRQRAIVVIMKRNAGKVVLEPWRERIHRSEADAIAASMSAWAQSATVDLVTTFPDLPEACGDRLMDLWEPLFIIAACAGGDWPERMERAFDELGQGTSTEPVMPPGMQLMADIRQVWAGGASRMSTADLVSALMSAEGSVWPSVWRDAAQIPHEMASLLRPYGVEPRKLRPEPGSAPVQGYLRSDFGVPGVPGVPPGDVPDVA